MAHPRMYEEGDPLLGRLRAICGALPEAVEFESHGRPNFRAGSRRVFAVYGSGPAHPHAVVLRVEPVEEEGLRADVRFFVPPYYPERLALDLDGPGVDWVEVAELVESAYRTVASARMLRELDAR
jgi:hypothetical protein